MNLLARCNLCGNDKIALYLKADNRWWCGCEKCAVSGKQYAADRSREKAIELFVDQNSKAGETYV